ncbi:ATP-binding cassette domain-containing protein [Rhizobium sp. YJ-22]|uniref:ABC transporter ATP-binding protein n=1 Tax=Rhizobium sp. YJ-22 TaxID=3037556 RepID=UPI0024121FEB|nr:ATP-binding cassette domain-containing protein [Rhizobium sp. YJ-22]MDG3579504.1 ATP-binding cassette domain-containing protein [Rhizobium sp. YJ-22]
MSSISLRQIKKSFAGLTILRSVDMEIEKGEFVVILGPSGCGKSTLLNVIAGLDDCDDGQIVIDGRDVIGLEPSQRGLAMVFQSYALFPAMTVRRNLSFGMEIAGTPKAEIVDKVAWVAKLLQIEPLLERKPSQLSGGQRQRVAIGRALVRSSSICLFDEPLSNLDAKLRAETRVELKQLHETLKSTMIYVTHDQIEAMTMADRVAVMHKGKVEQFAHPQSIYEKPASLFVAGFVGSPAMNFLDGRLDGAGRFITGDSDIAIDVSAYAFEAKQGAGEAVLGVRCEDITVTERGAPGSLPATLAFTELLGADALGWFDCLGKRFSTRLGIEAARAMKGEVGLTFDMGKASLFSKDTEQRL